MENFADFYQIEKSINLTTQMINKLDNKDKECINHGKKLANRFDLILNGWGELFYYFTIPAGVPDEKNTFTASNESEIVEKLSKRFPDYFKYIMDKNFPDGYKPDISISDEPPDECEPMKLTDFM
jgi:hypothetical protein